MLDKLTRQDFEKLIDQAFEIDFGEAGNLAAKLEKVEGFSSPPAGREPFSVVLSCPRSAPLDQKMYRVTHPSLGALDLFLVPIHGDDQGVLFEAVFT